MNHKKSKFTSLSRLPNLYGPALMRSENDYQREIHRKLDQLENYNRDAIRRCQANEHLFAHEHLTKRHQWYHFDKSYRDTCRTQWNKRTTESTRRSHIFPPIIYADDSESSFVQSDFQFKQHENSIIKNEKIKQKFLRVQPVMLEILYAPHSSRLFKNKYSMILNKIHVEQRQKHIQSHAVNDPRYQQLFSELKK